MKSVKDIEYGLHPRQKLNIYLPEKDKFDVFVFFHGGGLEGGSKEKNTEESLDFVSTVVDNGIAVVTANYRIYPTAVYPEFLRDGAAAIAWVIKNIDKYGKCGRIFVGGSSAGAYIAMMLCFDKKYLSVHRIELTDIAGFIFNAGQPTAHYNVLREKGIDSRRVIVDETAPLYYVGLDKEYPPMMFVVSDNDIPGRIEQTQLMLATIKSFGYEMSKVKYKLMKGTHTQHNNEFDKDGKNLMGKLINEFIQDVI